MVKLTKLKCALNMHNYIVANQVKGYLWHKNYNKVYTITLVCTACSKTTQKTITTN